VHYTVYIGCNIVSACLYLILDMIVICYSVIYRYLCLQIGKYDRQLWEQSVEQEVLKVFLT